jgi:hypothetical protein
MAEPNPKPITYVRHNPKTKELETIPRAMKKPRMVGWLRKLSKVRDGQESNISVKLRPVLCRI